MRNGKRSRREIKPLPLVNQYYFYDRDTWNPLSDNVISTKRAADSERFLSVSYEYEQQLADLSLPYISTRHHRLPAIYIPRYNLLQIDNCLHSRRICSAIQCFVLFPGFSYQTAKLNKTSTLYSFIHIQCMRLHFRE